MTILNVPTYEYECTECRHHFDEFQKITDPPMTKCPVCRGKLRRLISGGSGLIFKGSGFYVTDYKNTSLAAATPQKKDLQVKPPGEKKNLMPAKEKKSDAGGEKNKKTPGAKSTGASDS